jgi:uncharacterized protein (TIGR03086 family)
MVLMVTDAETLDLLERAVNQLDAIVARVRSDQEGLPTPCADWDVHALLSHVVGQAMPNFIVAATGGVPDWQAPSADVQASWIVAYRTAADELLSTWRAADMDRMVASGGGEAPLRGRADQQITELAVHGWDLAEATGHDGQLDPTVADHALAWSRRMLKPEYRGAGRGFGPEVPVAADAPSYDRLAGWFGRNPAWQPGSGSPANYVR